MGDKEAGLKVKRVQFMVGHSIAIAMLAHSNVNARAQTRTLEVLPSPAEGLKDGLVPDTTKALRLPPQASPQPGEEDHPVAKTLATGPKPPTRQTETQVEGFSALRHRLLETIAGARQRVWLTSEYLTDGEIVTALYLAHYRKLDVKVLLGRVKAQSPLSRLNYLKQQKVPVWLLPDSFNPGSP